MAAIALKTGSSVRRKVRIRALRYAITFTAPALAVAGLLKGGLWTWAVPMHAFVLIPLLESIIPQRHLALSEEEEAAALADPVHDALLYLVVPVQWILLALFLHSVQEPGLAPWEFIGRVFTMGVLCGIHGINVAHELGHRSRRWERVMARLLLLSSLYMHFIIEHNRGHHRRVATPEDPASARYGETVFGFWCRSIAFSWISAWRIEAERSRKKGARVLDLSNEMLLVLLCQAGLLAGIWMIFGTTALFAFMGAALIGILLLETVNYIEHYGLRRKRNDQGGYGRVQHYHSWNSDHLLGRVMLFELTRHSDHHWKASKKYQVLQSITDAPQLPTGYPGMMVLSLFPPLFFRVMHKRLGALADRYDGLEVAA